MILNKIADKTKMRVEKSKSEINLKKMKELAFSFAGKESFAFEKASPSKGIIAESFEFLEIVQVYEKSGAAAISVLTEPDFFMGSNSYLTKISTAVKIPVLRKDFTIDEYQLYQAKTIGADAVLLICSLLDTETIKRYISICDSLGLSALVEAHDKAEVFSALKAGARIIGVNNRNLQTFEVNISNSVRLRNEVPNDIIFVAESGIRTRADIQLLESANVNAVLIGETLMKSVDIHAEILRLKGEK
jgi:indole-3-glycerol phosphate synthase